MEFVAHYTLLHLQFQIIIMTSKGVQLRVQYPADQLLRDTHHIKVKTIPSQIRTYYKNRKSTKNKS